MKMFCISNKRNLHESNNLDKRKKHEKQKTNKHTIKDFYAGHYPEYIFYLLLKLINFDIYKFSRIPRRSGLNIT